MPIQQFIARNVICVVVVWLLVSPVGCRNEAALTGPVSPGDQTLVVGRRLAAGTFGASGKSALRESSSRGFRANLSGRNSVALALPERSSGSALPGVAARLASLHRPSSSRVASTRDGSREVLRLRALATRAALDRSSQLAPDRRPARGRSPLRATAACRGVAPANRIRRPPFRAFPPCGWVSVSRPLPSCGSRCPRSITLAAGPLQGFVPRTECLEVLK